MSEWQPIDTAPRDGTEILGLCQGHGWEAYNIVKWYWHKNMKTGNFKSNTGVWNPTHWMPLPAPPTN